MPPKTLGKLDFAGLHIRQTAITDENHIEIFGLTKQRETLIESLQCDGLVLPFSHIELAPQSDHFLDRPNRQISTRDLNTPGSNAVSAIILDLLLLQHRDSTDSSGVDGLNTFDEVDWNEVSTTIYMLLDSIHPENQQAAMLFVQRILRYFTDEEIGPRILKSSKNANYPIRNQLEGFFVKIYQTLNIGEEQPQTDLLHKAIAIDTMLEIFPYLPISNKTQLFNFVSMLIDTANTSNQLGNKRLIKMIRTDIAFLKKMNSFKRRNFLDKEIMDLIETSLGSETLVRILYGYYSV